MSNILTNNINPRSGNTININGTISGINVSGVSTIGNVVVGGATTELVVTGDARITGILTVGTESVTFNGNNGVVSGINTINSVSFPSTGALSNRNMVINGAMRIAQRSTSETSVTDAGYKTIDRYRWGLVNLGTWTLEQSTDAPDGFNKSFKATCTTADASPAASDILYLQYRMEAQDLQHLKFGTSDAVPMTVSFWVKSNKTGAASFMMFQNDNSNRLFSNSYTINTVDTWEYKIIAIPADTSGLIDDDNGIGLTMGWWLNSGSDSTGGSFSTTWDTYADANTNVSNLGVGGATSDNWLITGIQLEVGTQATPFEHRNTVDEYNMCHRYYYRLESNGTVSVMIPGFLNSATESFHSLYFPTPMRTSPTLEYSSISHFDYEPWDSQPTSSFGIVLGRSNSKWVTVEAETNQAGRAKGDVTFLTLDQSAGWMAFSAEL